MRTRNDDDAAKREDAAAAKKEDVERFKAAAEETGEPERDPDLTAEVAGRPADEKREVAMANQESRRMAVETAAARGTEAPAEPPPPVVTHSIEHALAELTFPATKDRIIAVARAAALEQTERFRLERLPDRSYPSMEELLREVSSVT